MMREQIVEQLLELFNPIDPSGRRLLEEAVESAENPFVCGPHVLLAATHLPEQMAALQKARAYRDLAELLHRPEVLDSLVRWINLPSDYSQAEYCTYGLLTALREARHLAGNDQLSGSTLLQAIVDHDIDTKTALAVARRNGASADLLSPSTPTWPSSPWYTSGIGYPAANGTFPQPTRREATTTLFYAERHRIPIEAVLRELALCEQNQLLIVRGLFGSPRQRLPHILADILVHPANPLDRQRFSEINHVFVQDIAAFHAASMQLRDGGAVAALNSNIRQARTLQGILVLTRGELLAGEKFHEANKQLLGALSQVQGVRIVISYEDSDELAAARELDLPLIHYRHVTMESHSAEHSVNAIHEYYDAYWRSLGVMVESDAVETVLQFEPAIYSYVDGILKRKALPYSLADLLNAAIETLRNVVTANNTSLLEGHARMAREHVMKLLDPDSEGEGLQLLSSVDALAAIVKNSNEDSGLRDKARNLYQRWLPTCEALGKLPGRMQALVEHPQVRKSPRTPLHIVTQDMVTAHLFSDLQYRVKLIRAFKDSVQLSAPPLLELIRKYVAQAAK